MGLFDKILKEVSEKAPDLKLDELAKNVSDAVSTLKTEAEKFAEENKDAIESFKTEAQKYAEEHKDAVDTVIPSGEDGPKPGAFGVSWGEEMPAEENLFNSGKRLPPTSRISSSRNSPTTSWQRKPAGADRTVPGSSASAKAEKTSWSSSCCPRTPVPLNSAKSAENRVFPICATTRTTRAGGTPAVTS